MSSTGSTFLLADDGTFRFHEVYEELDDVAYVNGTMEGIMPCQRNGATYTYFPCPGVMTRGLPEL